MPSLLPHSLSCIPGRVRVNNPPDTGAAAWDTAAASFPSLSRPGLGADRPGNKPKSARCGATFFALETRLPEGSGRFPEVPVQMADEGSGAVPLGSGKRSLQMPGQGCGGLWRFRRVPVGVGTFRCRCELKVPGFPEGSARFRQVPVQLPGPGSGGFRKVPGSSGARCGAKFRRVLEGSERGPRISGADAYCHVKDELHERASCHRRGDFLGTAPRLPAPESACIGHVGHVFGPCWLQLG